MRWNKLLFVWRMVLPCPNPSQETAQVTTIIAQNKIEAHYYQPPSVIWYGLIYLAKVYDCHRQVAITFPRHGGSPMQSRPSAFKTKAGIQGNIYCGVSEKEISAILLAAPRGKSRQNISIGMIVIRPSRSIGMIAST